MRIWVPGCATGEEAFSLAMLFQEAMDRLNKHLNVQIFATDINKETIEQARTARFPEGISADMPSEAVKTILHKRRQGIQSQKNDPRHGCLCRPEPYLRPSVFKT